MIYTNYAIVKDGVVVEYPVNPRVWNLSSEEFNVPELWLGGELNGKTYVYVHTFAPYCHPTLNLVEKTLPAFNSERNAWLRQYDFVAASEEEIAERRAMYVRGVQATMANLLAAYYQKVLLISSLPAEEQAKWDAYRDAVLAIPQQPDYPFVCTLPQSPESQVKIKIGVARI